MKILRELPPKTTANQTVSIDFELYHMRKHRLHRNNEGIFASMQICCDGNTVYVITDEKDVQKAVTLIHDSAHVFHNSAFDIRNMRRWAKYPNNMESHVQDTMLFERILCGGLYDGHAFRLKDLARRYLSIYVDKKEREEFADSDEMTPEMEKYGALDAVLTWKIYQEQVKIARPEDIKIWETVDRPALFAILDIRGFRMDVEKWKKLAEHNQEVSEKIRKELSFNPNSNPQTLLALQKAGLTHLTSTGAKELLRYREYPLVKQMLTYRETKKRASTYGLEFLENYAEGEYIYPEIEVTKAETGRMASNSPNVQNQVNTQEYRSCFIASEGNVILVADYSAQEPRITAFETQDKNLLDVITTSGDIHTVVGKKLFNKPTMTKKDPLRKKAKALNLGLTYGMTANGLYKKINDDLDEEISLAKTKEAIDELEKQKVTYDQAEELLSAYFRQFVGVKMWIDRQRKFAQKHGYVLTHSGRRVWVNRYSYSYFNNSINSPIQGGAADVIKLAVSRLWKECMKAKILFPVVAIVHDELVCDIPEKDIDLYKSLVEKCMVEEAEKLYEGIPFAVDLSVGKNWACKGD